MQIKHFIDNQWAEYADYDNRRSLPHLMDGLKITQRKAMCTAIALPKGDKHHKVSQFASKAAADTSYVHGEVSMMSAVVGLAQDHPGTNNYPLLAKHGQFGTRLSASASSPRYIHTRLHSNWNKFFKEEDQEIVIYRLDEDDNQIEPKYYIPIIPMLLVNGADGTGNGFKSAILNYSVESVVKALKEIIKHGVVKTPLVPHVNGFTGTIEKIGRQVTFTGKLRIIHSTKLHITELPPGYDNDKYKELLKGLIDKKFIKKFSNDSTEDKWDWTIECPRTTSELGVPKLLEKFGLIGKVSETFVCWGMDEAAPMTFETPEQLLTCWYEERMKLYGDSLAHQIAKMEAHITRLGLRIAFIKWCLKNDFRKLSKAEFIQQVITGVKHMTPELAAEFVGMPMYRITTDEVKKAALEIENNFAILEELDKTTPTELMERNLKGL